MKAKFSFVFASILFGIVIAGCSGPAKSPEDEKKAFSGGPMPKGFMQNMGGPGKSAQDAAAKAGQDAAAKAAAAHGGQ